MLLQTKTLKPKQFYDFDFDNQFISCEKFDSVKGKNMKQGYFIGVASIDNYIVYFENRNSNVNLNLPKRFNLLMTC